MDHLSLCPCEPFEHMTIMTYDQIYLSEIGEEAVALNFVVSGSRDVWAYMAIWELGIGIRAMGNTIPM